MLNGFNAKCLTTISVGQDSELNYGERIRKESIAETTTYDLVLDISRQRAAWLGHVLRYGEDRNVRAVVTEMYEVQFEGCLYEVAPHTDSLEEMIEMAKDRVAWRKFVKGIKPRAA